MPRDGFAAIGGTSQRGEPGGVNVGAVVATWEQEQRRRRRKEWRDERREQWRAEMAAPSDPEPEAEPVAPKFRLTCRLGPMPESKTATFGMTARALAAQILEDPDENWLRAGTVLVAALEVGPVNHRIAKHTGVPAGDVGNYGYRLRSVGIWRQDATLVYPWLDELFDGDPALGTVGFVMQTGIAVGDFVMSDDPLDPRVRLAMIGEGNDGLANPLYDGDVGPPWRKDVCRRLRSPQKPLV